MNSPLYNAGKEGGTGTKFCNICRYALASDFGIVSLTPLNLNVFQEIGLMQGLKKPLIYLLNPNLKEKLPFDIDDQIYVEHTDDTSLISGLNNKMPLLLDKLLLITGFETEQRELISQKVKLLSPKAKELLKRILLEGNFSFRSDSDHYTDLPIWVKERAKCDDSHLKELENHRFIISDTESGGSKTLKFKRFNEPYRSFLEELLFSNAQPGS